MPETIVAIELNRRFRGLLRSKCQEERRAGVFNAPLVNRQVRWHEVAIATRRDGWESTKLRLLAVRSLDMLIAVAQIVRRRDGREVAMVLR